jgi:hypothetical protein
MPLLKVPSYEFLFREFQVRHGLYILGAGASTGDVPFGESFMIGPAIDYVREAVGFPAIVPEQAELNRRIIEIATRLPVSRFFPEREFRIGTPEFPYREMLQRLPEFYAHLFLKHSLSSARFTGRRSDNYPAFQFFRPGIILNYNLDGLATEICSNVHRVIAAHGTVEPGYGSPRALEIIAAIRELDLPAPPDNLLLCIPEAHGDEILKRRLRAAAAQSPELIAIIGYSFGRQADSYTIMCRCIGSKKHFGSFGEYLFYRPRTGGITIHDR